MLEERIVAKAALEIINYKGSAAIFALPQL